LLKNQIIFLFSFCTS